MSEGRRRAYRLGRTAEALCVASLALRGYRILARGYRTPVGEIDIVARRGRTLAVIEVKARSDLAAAAEAIGPRQRRRILRATEQLLQQRPALAGLDLRFDAMLVAPGRPPRHLRDAWRP
ncbi:MAG: YraN family protein [Rhodospirillaceae bacterium]|nr:YraN family protein [Rhodospirillaceae bacterium]MBT6117544.1 YraN family protein [Rhodospirillaceae bacterium]